MPLKNVADAMHEFKRGDLHSGKGGPVVTSKKQALAIGLANQRRAQASRRTSRSLSGKR